MTTYTQDGEEVKLRWWTFSQNNSGGYFIRNEDVVEYVAIQAENVEGALERAYAIFADYCEFCECCGERWSYWIDEEDGTEVPEIYGDPYTEMVKSRYRESIILHYADGTKVKYPFKDEDKS